MIRSSWCRWRSLGLVALAVALSGCLSSGGSSSKAGKGHDFLDNDPDLIVAFGDSITYGILWTDGLPYPAMVEANTGKRTLNRGVSGDTSGDGLARLNSVLREKPGYLLILFGANDAIHGRSPDQAKENVRTMIQRAKAQGTIPLVGSTMPIVGKRIIFNSASLRMADAMREVAREEGGILVDLRREFEGNEDRLLVDGLHANHDGNRVIAAAFSERI